jgi:hypothetical protein
VVKKENKKYIRRPIMAQYDVFRNEEGVLEVFEGGIKKDFGNLKITVPPEGGDTVIEYSGSGTAHLDGSVYPLGIA